jgi:hypothetical protein
VGGSLEGGRPQFGDMEVDPELFPSLRAVGSGVAARANAAFLAAFRRLLDCSPLQSEVSVVATEMILLVLCSPIADTIWRLVTSMAWLLLQDEERFRVLENLLLGFTLVYMHKKARMHEMYCID